MSTTNAVSSNDCKYNSVQVNNFLTSVDNLAHVITTTENVYACKTYSR